MSKASVKFNLPHLIEDRDRHGKVRVYLRVKGHKKVRLFSMPGSGPFLDEYRTALAKMRAEEPRADRGPTAGTFAWLGRAYMTSTKFRALDDRSQRLRMAIIESCFAEPLAPGSTDTIGQVPLEYLEPKHIRLLRDRKAGKPGAAGNRLKYVRSMLSWAVEYDYVKINVARDVRSAPSRSEGFHTWTPGEVAQFEARYPIGTKARLALALLLYTGQRRSDVIQFGRQHLRGPDIVFRQKKTGKALILPFLAELAAIVAATPTGDLTFLVTDEAQPKAFTAPGFGARFRKWCDDAGLPQWTAHGLRKAGAVLVAERGATNEQMRAIFGWDDPRQAATYTQKASQKRLAADAMKLLVREQKRDESAQPVKDGESNLRLTS